MSVQALSWVFDHSPTKGTDRLVLLSIANHAGSSPIDGAWEAWPGAKLIQREARFDRDRTVQDALALLCEDGHLIRMINSAPDMRIRKDRRPNLYRILLVNGVTCGDTRCNWCGVTPPAERGDAERPDGVTPGDATGCRETSPKPNDEPSVEPKKQPEPFDVFWAAYPNKVAKGAARKAWVAATRLASVEIIVAGAERLASDPNRDPTYTPHPSTWLRAERWLDPPLPARIHSQARADVPLSQRIAPENMKTGRGSF